MHQYSIRCNADSEVKMQFEKLDIVNLIVVVGLVIGLIMAIFYNRTELANNITVGLLGFLGGIIRTTVNNKDVTK